MPTKCRAAIQFEARGPLQVKSVEVSDPGPGEVLVRLSTAGLCHSDLHFIEGATASFIEGGGSYPTPAVFGHEGFGHVAAAGAGVSALKAGDAVVPYAVPECGVCPYCQSGRSNWCVEMGRNFTANPKTWISHEGQPVVSFGGLGTFSEYIVVREDQLIAVANDAPPLESCSIGCAVATGVGSALLVAKVQPGSTVAVFGAGGVGLSVVQGAGIAGATRIIVIDVNDAKEPVARAFGATDFINGSKTDAVAQLMAWTQVGVDYAFDCVGCLPLTKQALACLAPGWGVGVSVAGSADERLRLTHDDVAGKWWSGTFMGSSRHADVARYVDWVLDGTLKLDGLVSHRLTLDDINEGFELMKRGETARAVIEY